MSDSAYEGKVGFMNWMDMKYIDPEEPLHEGLGNRKWIDRQDLLEQLPNQPESNKNKIMSETIVINGADLTPDSDEPLLEGWMTMGICTNQSECSKQEGS